MLQIVQSPSVHSDGPRLKSAFTVQDFTFWHVVVVRSMTWLCPLLCFLTKLLPLLQLNSSHCYRPHRVCLFVCLFSLTKIFKTSYKVIKTWRRKPKNPQGAWEVAFSKKHLSLKNNAKQNADREQNGQDRITEHNKQQDKITIKIKLLNWQTIREVCV